MGFSLGGLLGGAVSGGGQAVSEVAQSDIDAQHKTDLAQQMSDLEVEKQQRIQENQVVIGNQQRQAQVDRIGAIVPGLLATQQAGRLNDWYNKDNAANGLPAQNLGPDDYSDEEKAMAPPSTEDKNNAYLQAAIQTGDMGPQGVVTLAGMTNKAEMNQLRVQMQMDRTESQAEWRTYGADVKLQVANMVAGTAAARLAAKGDGKGDSASALEKNVALLQTLGYSPDDVKNFIFDKKQPSLEALAVQIMANDLTGKTTIADAATKAQALRTAVAGIAKPAAPAPAPGAAPPAVPGRLPGESPQAYLTRIGSS